MSNQDTKTQESSARLVREQAWHTLSVSAVENTLETKRAGLFDSSIRERVERYGLNVFTKTARKNIFSQVYEQLKSPLTLVLILAFIITLVLQEYVDAFVIAAALTIAVVVGVVQEGRASRAFEVLRDSQIHHAIVIRDGAKHQILANELVPGDVVVIEGGMQVPADIRLFETKKLSINEAVLTGEWQSVSKNPEKNEDDTPLAERSSMAWMGTSVAEGYGAGYVVATGDATEVGKLAKDLDTVAEVATPLQSEMAKISRVMLLLIIGLVAIIFVIGLVRGEALEEMLLMAIAIAVASIPEGLPAAVTIVLAIGMEALLKRGGLVRNLLAAETLGSTTYVLTDKTGTLTEAKMAITAATFNTRTLDRNHMVSSRAHEARVILDTALCASNAFLDRKNKTEDSFAVRGEPIERAILDLSQKLGIPLEGEGMRGHRVDYLPFSSENRFAAGLTDTLGSDFRVCVNGAPEYVLEAATSVRGEKGVMPLDENVRTYFNEEIIKNTREGKRLIAIAYKEQSEHTLSEDTHEIMSNLTLIGLLIFHDPAREGVGDAISGVIGAGAQVRLVTGDNPETALSIAREVGIAREHDIALTGKDIAGLGDDELYEALKTVHVFARVLPRQKMRLASVLQKHGEIVAMTGDGINDAPALQRANIGIAIGSGTEVAKEASDLVLVEDSFATIYSAIDEGRRIISNLRKIVGYLLSTSLSEAVLIAAALLIGAPIPILPAQILWANIIEEGLMSVAFAFEPGDKNAMKEKPQDIQHEGVLSFEMMKFIGLVVAVLSALLIMLYFWLLSQNISIEMMRSVMFLAISLDSLFIAFSFRSLAVPAWRVPLRTNIFFLVSVCINIALLSIAVTVPFMQFVLSYEPLPLWGMAAAFVYAILAMLMIEVGKWIFFRQSALDKGELAE